MSSNIGSSHRLCSAAHCLPEKKPWYAVASCQLQPACILQNLLAQSVFCLLYRKAGRDIQLTVFNHHPILTIGAAGDGLQRQQMFVVSLSSRQQAQLETAHLCRCHPDKTTVYRMIIRLRSNVGLLVSITSQLRISKLDYEPSCPENGFRACCSESYACFMHSSPSMRLGDQDVHAILSHYSYR